jgi:hypothetical protein
LWWVLNDNNQYLLATITPDLASGRFASKFSSLKTVPFLRRWNTLSLFWVSGVCCGGFPGAFMLTILSRMEAARVWNYLAGEFF